jgi:hypothetical protein
LIPVALGPDSEAQSASEAALVMLSTTGHRGEVEKVAREYGGEAAKLVAALLARDPLAIAVSPPKPPPFLRMHELSDVTLRSGKSIGEGPRAALVEMLQISPVDVPYAGLTLVREACSEESLARLAVDLLEQWVLGDLPGRHEWMLFATAHFPSEAGTRRVAALAREWARKNGAKASRLCVALSAIGTDAALMALAHIADTTRYDALKTEAASLRRAAADARDLSLDELGDRTVPDVGLDANGTMTLSYGARSFVVSLDETLSPVVRDGATRLRSLPRATKADDAALAKAARERFDALSKDLASIAQRQLRRLERAMVDGRTWSADDFRAYLAGQPMLVHVARRLVWKAVVGDATTTFRIAEDGSFADEHDHVFFLEEGARVRIAHPARTPDMAARWAQIFADYEILQPFAQLGRPIVTIEPGERTATTLARTEGITVSPRKLLGVLESRGWQRNDAGHPTSFTREVRSSTGEALVARLPISPGFEIADLRHATDVTTGALVLETLPGAPRPFGDLDPVTFSELASDVSALGKPA